ncbi:MAG: recombinase family protein [Oceanicaulis sp.]
MTMRCAIYTRKSTEEGLDQAFNSLDAQHEACAAYIASQRHEGWKLLTERYDDGGVSGGTLDRPAVQRLLADIDAGRVDMVVVYKIDRLTRSLADFARLVERFDKAGCSFVSVTQAFNTSTSMGRLTLNVLLSFAQFEREVTGERIRDKIAASKKKGMWMGGMVPLGYDVRREPERGLVVNAGEAATVRTIFALYDELEDLKDVAETLKARGVVSKVRTFERSGRRFGGKPLSHGQVHFILTNPVYRGLIRHKGEVYEGQHKAIIDADLWERVQEKLQAHARRKRRRDDNTGKLAEPKDRSPLAGRVYDETGDRLTPSATSSRRDGSSKRRIRYYVSTRLIRTKARDRADDPAGWRLPAAKLERAVAGAVIEHLIETGERLTTSDEPTQLFRVADRINSLTKALQSDLAKGPLREITERILVAPGSLAITLSRAGLAKMLDIAPGKVDADKLAFETGFTIRRRGVEMKLVTGTSERARDNTLIRMLAAAQAWLDEVRAGTSMAEIGRRYGWTDAPVRQRIRLALLSPAITAAILEGHQPPELTAHKLLKTDIPLDWDRQAERLGFNS